MPKFVVFLRGINVGGHVVTKEQLLRVFTSSKFNDVSTFKQSGNVILESETSNADDIRKTLETKLRQALGFDVYVFVRTSQYLKQLIQLDPFKGQDEKNADFQVTFLAGAPTELRLKLPVRIPNSTADVISIHGTEVFSLTRGNGDGGKPNPFLESKLQIRATTRNWNIIKDIVERYG